MSLLHRRAGRAFAFVVTVLALPLCSLQAASYEWGFTSGNLNADLGGGSLVHAGLTGNITTFGTTNGTTVPHIGGTPASYMSVPQMPSNTYGYDLTLTNSGPNGGGSYINQYTFAFDMLVPALPGTGYLALLNTNASNANDADFYIVASAGAANVGVTGNPYSAGAPFALNAWNRLVITADLAVGSIKMFINGTRVVNATGYTVDGTWALFSNANAGSDVRLFNENYADANNYTQAFYLSAASFVDRTYSESEVAALGGAKAAGILVPEPSTAVLLLGSLGALALRRRRPASR